MSEIADFLRARLAERRALAEAAAEDSGREWSPGDEHLGSSVNEAESGAAVVIGPWEYLDWDVRRHIAANDPAAVIADCDAKQRLLAAILAEPHAILRPGGSTAIYCDADSDPGDPCECGRDARVSGYLHILAQPFAGHADHKGEEWAP